MKKCMEVEADCGICSYGAAKGGTAQVGDT